MKSNPIPFLDLARFHRAIKPELDEAYQRTLSSSTYVLGAELEAFELEYSKYVGVDHCIGVANGLDALYLILVAYGIGPGDEVIVPSNTFIATWLAVSRTGAKIVPVEPREDTYNLDCSKIEAAISVRTKAIIPVHLYGQIADMTPIIDLGLKYGIKVIEDAAQSQGATYKGLVSGAIGSAAATSFYPGKNLGAFGDGGAITTNDQTLASNLRKLRNYGSTVKYSHELLGFNSRLDELQAAFLRVKLKHINSINAERKFIATEYSNNLYGEKITKPIVAADCEHVWHLYVIQHPNRDQLQKRLLECGVTTVIHYPEPPHRQACYSNYATLSLPICENQAKHILSLPIFPGMTSCEIARVIDIINNFES